MKELIEEFRPQEVLNLAKQVFTDEIASLVNVQQHLDTTFVDAINMLFNCHGKVIVAGMGKSGHIANKIAATFASTGTPAFFLHPAEALHGDLGMIDHNDLLIAISYSGESDELSAIIPLVRRRQVKVIGIGGNRSSTLANLADCFLHIPIIKEACPLNLAPTSSTTATLLLGDALAVALLSLRKFKPEDFALSHPGGNLGRRLLTKVSDIMHAGERIPKVLAQAKFKDIVVEISKKGLGFVAITDNDDQLIGIITDGDLRRAFDLEIDTRSLIAQQIMIGQPKTILEGSLAIDALAVMDKYKINGLLVVNHNNKLVGAFNMHDLFKARLI